MISIGRAYFGDTSLHDEEVGVIDIELNGVKKILDPTADKQVSDRLCI